MKNFQQIKMKNENLESNKKNKIRRIEIPMN